MRLRFAVLTFALVACSETTRAATYYVSTSGNDANAGSLSAPFRTISKAAGVARAGDVVEVRGGVYEGAVNISSKGTATAPITFRAYSGEKPILDGSSMAVDSNLVTLANATYVDFSGFEIRNAKRLGIC